MKFTAEECYYAQALLNAMCRVEGMDSVPKKFDDLPDTHRFNWSQQDLVRMAMTVRNAKAYVDPDESLVQELTSEYDCPADLVRKTLRRERARVAK